MKKERERSLELLDEKYGTEFICYLNCRDSRGSFCYRYDVR